MSSDQKKLCLICGNLSPADAVTCPHDGEASWGASAIVDAILNAAEEQPSADPPRRKKATR